MNTDVAPRLGAWRQSWKLAAAAAAGLPAWLAIGVLLRGQDAGTRSWFLIGDPLVALGCLTVLLWRRRFPLTVALTVAIASPVSALATGAALLALASLSARRRPVEIGLVGSAYVTASQPAVGIYPVQSPPGSLWYQLAIPVLTAGIAVAVGMAVGSRRAEVRSLRERAESAEREQTARAAQARVLERNRIAREMHDVLAHRISLVAMQAGVLNHRGDLAAEENRVLVRGIADGSRQALEELRDVLGLLRAEPGHPEPLPPTLDRIPELVADARTSGLDVTLTTTVTDRPSDAAGRTCYRIVQEGLTNAAKHAPGAQVHITLEGKAGGELGVSVRNSPAATMSARPPGSGFGLLGLSERIDLAGGRLDHRPTADNGYLLTARLPWPDATHEKRT
ncbi:sensor histidine kinase [Streptomyces sp. Ru87]|uniref:sensor histidine kinase n=1 Tax=Streptomyces sp. Ru87 TaxID=2044307 RepID=UPI000BF8EB6D|nr:histidine kinase [Streptomyces sp. Ru87]PGH47304.1 two-component sensor histidine kinase [Streptomyces sp. Ru87]